MANVSRTRYNMVTGAARRIATAEMRHGSHSRQRAASASYISFRSLSSCQLFVFESVHIYSFRATRCLVIDGRMYVHIYVHVNRYALRRVFCSVLQMVFLRARNTDGREMRNITQMISHLRDDTLRASARVHNVSLACRTAKSHFFSHTHKPHLVTITVFLLKMR